MFRQRLLRPKRLHAEFNVSPSLTQIGDEPKLEFLKKLNHPQSVESKTKVKDSVRFLNSVESKRQHRSTRRKWQKPDKRHIVPGINVEWKNYSWFSWKLSQDIHLRFKKQIKAGLPLVLYDGRVFTSDWRSTDKTQNTGNSIQSEPYTTSSPTTGFTSADSDPADQDIAMYITEERFDESEQASTVSRHDIRQLKKIALRDELIRIFTQQKPPSIPVSPVNRAGILRLMDVVAPWYNDYAIPKFAHSDTTRMPRYSKDFSEQRTKSYTLEWITLSTMMLPVDNHYHSDLLMTYEGDRIRRTLSKDVYHELTAKGYGVEDLDRWISCAAAKTASRALAYMSGAIAWPPFLLGLLLMRKLEFHTIFRVMDVIEKNFRHLNKRSQMIVMIRMARHIARIRPSLMSRLCTVFVEQASVEIRTTFIYNKILKIISFHKRAYDLNYSGFFMAAQKIIIKDMGQFDVNLNREGYISLANVLQAESPGLAHKMLEIMSARGYALTSLGRKMKVMLSLDSPDKEIVQFYPIGRDSEEAFAIYQAKNVYEASALFDKLANKDTTAWMIFLTKLENMVNFTTDQAMTIWSQIKQSKIKPNHHIICLLMRSLDNVNAGVRILMEMEEMHLGYTRQVMTQFLYCCHRDRQNVYAMTLGRLYATRLRPHDKELRASIHRINRIRRAAVRYPMME
ncbi:hypothetical protein V1512DRAFT_264119 [Lipomyces arxii]|uniref:uncharacterized protein n=1 Tax=Lipomyces arxii TaxID=56418 RepID=UPI0034CEC0F0